MADQKAPLFYQGVHSFRSFEEYHQEWLLPSTLGDLETIFEGTTICWRADPMRARGNFALATTLMAAMDHVGSFLRTPDEPINNWLNMSLCASLPRSTYGVSRIIAYAGRNTLIHETWLATMLVITEKDKTTRLGLNLNANEDTQLENRLLYWREYIEPLDPLRNPQGVLKLRLIVYSILEDFRDLLHNWPVEVSQQVFEQVQLRSGRLCHFRAEANENSCEERLDNRTMSRSQFEVEMGKDNKGQVRSRKESQPQVNKRHSKSAEEIRYLYAVFAKSKDGPQAPDGYIKMPSPEVDFRKKLILGRNQNFIANAQ